MEELYSQIPEYPTQFNAGTVLARIIDSLGFRYHWASRDLTQDDLDYRAGGKGRSIKETLDHIYFLVRIIENSFTDGICHLPEKSPGLEYQKIRQETLDIINSCSSRLKSMSDQDLASLPVKFDLHGTPLEFPYWNLINGPYCDTHYHVGQIVSMRRAAGNPVDPNVHVFFGNRIDPEMAEALRPSSDQ